MAFSRGVWDQVKNLTADNLTRALARDGWILEGTSGAVHAYLKTTPIRQRVTVHYHPGKTYGPKLLQALLADIGWTEDDLRRLKLIK